MVFIATTYIRHLFKFSWELGISHLMILCFCRRIASECMMVISSGQCVFVVSLFIDCIISANCRHRPLATDPGHVTC